MAHIPVSALARRTLSLILSFGAVTSTALALGPRANGPALSLPIGPLGFQAVPSRLLAAGGSMFTLHFVDGTHLLFTFNNRGLLKRMPDATPEDDDRNVTALLLELPSGKVLARTEWRTRDREQYLWPLSHGRFLLRVRTHLTVIDPLANLAKEEAFREQPLLEFKRRIGFISVSPGGDLLTIETVPPRHQIDDGGGSAQAVQPPQPQTPAQAGAAAPLKLSAPPAVEFSSERAGLPPVDLHFYRLGVELGPAGTERVAARTAGVLGARNLISIPATGDGFIDAMKESPGVYDFDFFSHTGKKLELSPYDTTCAPRAYFVSASEFVALGCHGGTDRMLLSGFNLRGEEPWVQALSGQYIAPYLVAAPAAGRFAFSRVLVAGSYYDPDNIIPEELTAQEITVLQQHDGRLLLKVQASPIQRAGQNFDLSSDGLAFAVLRAGNIEVYRLGPLSGQDQRAVEAAAKNAPERNDAQVRLKSAPIPPAQVEAAPAVTVAARPAGSTLDAAPQAAESTPEPAEPERKPPSLYSPEHPKDQKQP